MTDHTPGPWIYERDQTIEVDAECGRAWIGEVYGPTYPVGSPGGAEDIEPDPEEVHANGYLFAAAPELLAACEAMMSISDLWLPDAAVAEEHVDEAVVLSRAHGAIDAAIKKARGGS